MLTSSPCVRDVCDAIIVHALRQSDDQPPPPGDVEAGPDEPQCRRATDSDRFAVDGGSRAGEAGTDSRFGTSPTDGGPRSADPSHQRPEFDESKAAAAARGVVDAGGRQSDAGSASSRRCESRSKEPGDDCQVDQQAALRVADRRESPTTDLPSRSADSKSSFHVSGAERVPSRIDHGGANAAAAGAEDDAGRSDGSAKRTESASIREAEDVDVEDQPLCIDLNRDTSPDDDDDTVARL